MKPSLVQRFFASKWPLGLWFAATSVATCILSLFGSGFSFEYLHDWHVVGLYLLLIIISVPLGFMLGVFPGWFLIGLLSYARSIVNGGPFKVGDKVQIIGGTQDGRIAQIYSTWQGVSVRVDLGEEAKKEFKDIFLPTQLLKVTSQTGINSL